MLGVIEHQAKSATGERDRATFEYIAKRIREHLEKLDKEKGEKDKDKDKGGI
jgi:rubrerythrin